MFPCQRIGMLSQCFSPGAIAGWLRLLFPGRQDMWVSHETIYQAL